MNTIEVCTKIEESLNKLESTEPKTDEMNLISHTIRKLEESLRMMHFFVHDDIRAAYIPDAETVASQSRHRLGYDFERKRIMCQTITNTGNNANVIERPLIEHPAITRYVTFPKLPKLIEFLGSLR